MSTDILFKARTHNSRSYIDDLVRTNTDAITPFGHVSFELSKRGQENIRPHLNKDYAALCLSTVSVTNPLFGNELESQLSHIRESNTYSQLIYFANISNQMSCPPFQTKQVSHSKPTSLCNRVNDSVGQLTEQLCKTCVQLVQQSNAASS